MRSTMPCSHSPLMRRDMVDWSSPARSVRSLTLSGRAEMAAKEQAEAAVLADYLPEQLSGEEVSAIVSAAIEKTGAAGEGMKGMGKVMGVVQPQVKGRADGGAVAAEVRRQLG